VYSFSGGQSATLSQAVIHGGTGEGQYFSKDVEVWTSADGSIYTQAASGTLANSSNDSITLGLGGTVASNVKLVVTSGYRTDYWELAEFEVMGAYGGSGGTGGSAPTADFTADTTSGPAPLTVNFTDLSTETPTVWSWTFGDTGTSSLENPSHNYLNPGLYTVTLTAENAAGADLETKVDYINVPEPGLLTQLVAGVFGLFMLNGYRKRG
jgi:PKD repeat protein